MMSFLGWVLGVGVAIGIVNQITIIALQARILFRQRKTERLIEETNRIQAETNAIWQGMAPEEIARISDAARMLAREHFEGSTRKLSS